MEQANTLEKISLYANNIQNVKKIANRTRDYKKEKRYSKDDFFQVHTKLIYIASRLPFFTTLSTQENQRDPLANNSSGFVTLPTLIITLLILMTSAQFLKSSRKYHATNKELISSFRKRWH